MSFFKKSKNENEENIGNSTQPMTEADQLKKIADHLVFLEKKIDQLLDSSRGARKPFGQRFGGSGSGDFQRPRNNFRPSNGYGPRPSGNGGGNGRPYGQGRPSGGRPYEGNRSEGRPSGNRPEGGRPYEGNRPDGNRPPRHNRQS